MRQLLANIRSGEFAKTWVAENDVGRPHFTAARLADADHPIEQVGVRLRALMPFLDARVVRPDMGVANLAGVSLADRSAVATAT
jgi:ketol-acid reductoisomerase